MSLNNANAEYTLIRQHDDPSVPEVIGGMTLKN